MFECIRARIYYLKLGCTRKTCLQAVRGRQVKRRLPQCYWQSDNGACIISIDLLSSLPSSSMEPKAWAPVQVLSLAWLYGTIAIFFKASHHEASALPSATRARHGLQDAPLRPRLVGRTRQLLRYGLALPGCYKQI